MPPRRQPQIAAKPVSKTHLSDSEIARILAFAHMGHPSRGIADKVGRSQSTVSRIIRTYDYETFNSRSLTRICKRKTTKHEDRILLRTAKKHDDMAFRDIIHISGYDVSASTLRRRLREVELFSCIRRLKPTLTQKHKAARLQWARKHQNWTVRDWIRVIWSDECSIVLGRKSRRRRCIRKKGKAHLSRHCDKTVKAGKVTVMVWACFSGHKVGRLIPCDVGAVNAERYLDILSNGVVSFVEELFAPELGADTITVVTQDAYLFMHDNAPCHTAKRVADFLKQQRLPTMKWPAQSPDLNPIENLWVDLKERFHKRFFQEGLRPSTRASVVQRCKGILEELWHEQGMELITKLVESMPRRVAAVIAARGGSTKY